MSFGYSQGVENICICIGKVWLCGDNSYTYGTGAYKAEAYKYYKLPYQGPYYGTGPK